MVGEEVLGEKDVVGFWMEGSKKSKKKKKIIIVSRGHGKNLKFTKEKK